MWFKSDVSHTTALQVCYNFPGVLQLTLKCATTSIQNTYNYVTTSNAMLQKNQGTVTNTKKLFLYKAHHINIDCGFELRC